MRTNDLAKATLKIVELVHAYSNLSAVSLRLVQLRRMALSHHDSRRAPNLLVPQRIERRFGAKVIERIVTEYASGTSTTRLAESYGIGKGTLLRLLRESGVRIGPRGPRPH
jgi:hypothetical protein